MAEPLHLSPLDEYREEIRLLHVDVTDQPERCRHRLVSNVPFKLGQRTYSALSYPWGARDDYDHLTVDNRRVQVLANLGKALNEVVTLWKEKYLGREDGCYLWIDQLCVNHANNHEKSCQVKLMSAIYREAEEVLVWLPISTQLRGSLVSWGDWEVWHRQQIEDKAATQLLRNEPMTYNSASKEYPMISNEDRRDRDLMSAWSHIHAIITNVWWTRAWAFAEFISSTRATFLVQGLAIPWPALYDLLALYFNRRKDHLKLWANKTEDLRQREEKLRSFPVERGTCFGLNCGSSEQVSMQAEIDTVVQQRTFIEDFMQQYGLGDESWYLVNYILNQKEKRTAAPDDEYMLLSDLMRHGHSCECSDPRDKVFAFLGLARHGYDISPDYSMSTNEVFLKTAQAIIKHEHRLDVIALARQNGRPAAGSEPLPSWVPDWAGPHSLNAEYREFTRQIKLSRANSRASQNVGAEVTFHKNFLRAKGIRADRLSEMLQDPTHHPYRRFRTENGREVSTVKQAKTGDEVWVLLGANEPFTLRKGGSYYMVLGHAMLFEAGGLSIIHRGALIDQLANGDVTLEEVQIA